MNTPGVRRRRRRRKTGRVLLTGLLLAAIGAAVLFFSMQRIADVRYPLGYRELVTKYAEEQELPESLVYAMIHTESVFDPQAVSDVDARGLMQIRRDTFDWISGRMKLDPLPDYDGNVFDPETNIRYGTFLIRLLYDEFGTYELALCAYHAGRGNVISWLKDPEISPDGETVDEIPFSDTRWYVDRVMQTREIYQKMYDLP